MLQTIFTTHSADDTIELGQKIGSQIRGGEVIQLSSDVGGGKTTLVKGIAKGMGSDEVVQSPTFIVSAVYECANDIRLYHYDFYRLNDAGIMRDQLQESLLDPKTVSIIEWSGIVQDLFDQELIMITLKSHGDEEREITFELPDDRAYILEGIA